MAAHRLPESVQTLTNAIRVDPTAPRHGSTEKGEGGNTGVERRSNHRTRCSRCWTLETYWGGYCLLPHCLNQAHTLPELTFCIADDTKKNKKQKNTSMETWLEYKKALEGGRRKKDWRNNMVRAFWCQAPQEENWPDNMQISAGGENTDAADCIVTRREKLRREPAVRVKPVPLLWITERDIHENNSTCACH